MFITLTGGDWSITIASSSREEEVDSGEEMELASLCPTNLSSLFSRTKLLEIFDKSVVFCGFPKLSFKSGGEGAPVTRPPLDWVFSLHGSVGVFWQLLMLSASFWTETEVLNDPVEVNRDEDTVGKDNTPEIKKNMGVTPQMSLPCYKIYHKWNCKFHGGISAPNITNTFQGVHYIVQF